jgi:(1->4)-alpha-D-glucan 1-alpha-D-glucosylmutase
VVPFAERLAALGEQIALSQTLLKLTCPGIPDLYQGDELWSLSLVDPDNRRPIDWRRNARLLAELQRGAKPTREIAKLYLVWKTLQLRAEHPAAFAGSYEPVDAGRDICAYLRGDEILVAVPVRPGAQVEVPNGFVDVLGLDFGGRLLRRV